jgi:hypothetical protein
MKFSTTFSTTIAIVLSMCSAGLNAVETNSHRQQVETLFQLTQMEKKIQESVDSVVQLQLRQNPQLAQHQQTVHAFFEKHMGWAALKNDITEMYMRSFTEKELEQINAFYITPAGQKVIKVLPELVQQRNQLAMQKIQMNIGELQQAIAAPTKK